MVTGSSFVRTMNKQGQTFVSIDDLIIHIQALAMDYNRDGQDIVGNAYDRLAENLAADMRR